MKTNLLSLFVVVFAFFGGQNLFSQLPQDNLYFEFFSYCQAPVNVEIEVKSTNLASNSITTHTYCATILPGNNKLMDFERTRMI